MRHYPKAPIIEAILDIQVRTSEPVPQEVLSTIGQSLASGYPEAAGVNISQLRVGLNVTPLPTNSVSVAHTVSPLGLRLIRPNQRVLILQTRGITFSHLPPYTSWETFEPEAREIWATYVRVVKPEAVTRVALRYINRIDIPEQRFEPSDYFKLYPEFPKSIPQDMTAMFMQLQMPQQDLGPDVMAAINFATAGATTVGTVSMILDVDVFAVREISIRADEVFGLMSLIHDRKNELFEAFITDKTRELFRE